VIHICVGLPTLQSAKTRADAMAVFNEAPRLLESPSEKNDEDKDKDSDNDNHRNNDTEMDASDAGDDAPRKCRSSRALVSKDSVNIMAAVSNGSPPLQGSASEDAKQDSNQDSDSAYHHPRR